ncbi:MAG TPA: hypothetical protein DIT85_12740 [Pantoea ananatis]|nr:hypothetical protein B7764_16300 [Pantoea ananatis]HCP27293.1 hypothetical protein [Pantoea ananatis]
MIRFVMVVHFPVVPVLVTTARNVTKKSMNAFVMRTNAAKAGSYEPASDYQHYLIIFYTYFLFVGKSTGVTIHNFQ